MNEFVEELLSQETTLSNLIPPEPNDRNEISIMLQQIFNTLQLFHSSLNNIKLEMVEMNSRLTDLEGQFSRKKDIYDEDPKQLSLQKSNPTKRVRGEGSFVTRRHSSYNLGSTPNFVTTHNIPLSPMKDFRSNSPISNSSPNNRNGVSPSPPPLTSFSNSYSKPTNEEIYFPPPNLTNIPNNRNLVRTLSSSPNSFSTGFY